MWRVLIASAKAKCRCHCQHYPQSPAYLTFLWTCFTLLYTFILPCCERVYPTLSCTFSNLCERALSCRAYLFKLGWMCHTSLWAYLTFAWTHLTLLYILSCLLEYVPYPAVYIIYFRGRALPCGTHYLPSCESALPWCALANSCDAEVTSNISLRFLTLFDFFPIYLKCKDTNRPSTYFMFG